MKSEVHNLVCRADLPFATACLASLQRTASEQIHLTIHEDGSLAENDIRIVRLALPDAEIIRRRDAEDYLQSALEKYPTLRNARSHLPIFIKLLDIPLLSNANFVNYVDSDILFLRPHCELFLSGADVHANARFMRDLRSAYGFRIRNYAPFGFVHPISCLNAGLFSVRRDAIDFAWLEFIARQIGIDQLLRHRSWSEQGLWAVLASRLGCELIDPEQIVSAEDTKRLSQDRIALHFVTPTRHLLRKYLDCAPSARAPERIRAYHARRRGFLGAARDAIQFRASRFRAQLFS
jgi:hypothetical protein